MTRTRSVSRYEIVAPLARGGMATLYLARTTGVGGFVRHVALKVLADHTPASVQMFLDEARLVGLLHHPHINQVFDVGYSDEVYYIAMEYVHGVNLHALRARAFERRTELALDAVLTIIRTVASALHYAHELRDGDGHTLGIVHRDISPANVIAAHDGDVKLIDFGIARSQTRTTRTSAGLIKGTSGYMAPEYLRGRTPDRRSDLFALGVILYELTCHRRAFDGDDGPHRIVAGALPAPSEVRPGYPRDLERVVLAALETDPEDRIPSAAALIAAIDGVAQRHGLRLGPERVVAQLRALYGQPPLPWSRVVSDDAITQACIAVARRSRTPSRVPGTALDTRPTRPRIAAPPRRGQLARGSASMDSCEVEIEVEVEVDLDDLEVVAERPGTVRGIGGRQATPSLVRPSLSRLLEPPPPPPPPPRHTRPILPPPLPIPVTRPAAPTSVARWRLGTGWRILLGLAVVLMLGAVAGVVTHRILRGSGPEVGAAPASPMTRPSHRTLALE